MNHQETLERGGAKTHEQEGNVSLSAREANILKGEKVEGGAREKKLEKGGDWQRFAEGEFTALGTAPKKSKRLTERRHGKDTRQSKKNAFSNHQTRA